MRKGVQKIGAASSPPTAWAAPSRRTATSPAQATAAAATGQRRRMARAAAYGSDEGEHRPAAVLRRRDQAQVGQ